MSGPDEEHQFATEFRQEVATWNSRRLLKALTTKGGLFTDSEIYSIDSELRKRRIRVPIKCPVCALINPLPTSECPACGYNLSEATTAASMEGQLCSRCRQANGEGASECVQCGHALIPALQTTRMLQDNEDEIESLAGRALKGSLMCFLFPGYGLFLAPFAMSRAIDALGALSELHKRYPDHALRKSTKVKALAALVLGTPVFLFNVILVLYFVLFISRIAGLTPDVLMQVGWTP